MSAYFEFQAMERSGAFDGKEGEKDLKRVSMIGRPSITVGAAIGSVIAPGIGTAIGGGIGAIVGLIAAIATDKK